MAWAAWVSAGWATALRSHRWWSSSCSRAWKSAPAAPRFARARRKASEVAKDTYSRTVRAASLPCAARAAERARPRPFMEPMAAGSGRLSQPAIAYSGSWVRIVFSSFERDQIASQTSRPNSGIITVA